MSVSDPNCARRRRRQQVTSAKDSDDSIRWTSRFVRMGRASLLECVNHLIDAVDRGHITEDVRVEHQARAQQALFEIGGLLDYLQSPAAAANAKRIKNARVARRRVRTANENKNENKDPGTGN
jgi:hypothetical protein